MSTGTKVFLGILGAAAAGVAIGMLIAPEKGSEMRTRIKKSAGDWIDNLSNLFIKGKEELEEMAEEGKTAAQEKVNRMKESFS